MIQRSSLSTIVFSPLVESRAAIKTTPTLCQNDVNQVASFSHLDSFISFLYSFEQWSSFKNRPSCPVERDPEETAIPSRQIEHPCCGESPTATAPIPEGAADSVSSIQVVNLIG